MCQSERDGDGQLCVAHCGLLIHVTLLVVFGRLTVEHHRALLTHRRAHAPTSQQQQQCPAATAGEQTRVGSSDRGRHASAYVLPPHMRMLMLITLTPPPRSAGRSDDSGLTHWQRERGRVLHQAPQTINPSSPAQHQRSPRNRQAAPEASRFDGRWVCACGVRVCILCVCFCAWCGRRHADDSVVSGR